MRNRHMEGRVRNTTKINSAVESNRNRAIVAPIVDIVANRRLGSPVESNSYTYQPINVGPAKSRKWAAPANSGATASGQESIRTAMVEVEGYPGKAASIEVEEPSPSSDPASSEVSMWNPYYGIHPTSKASVRSSDPSASSSNNNTSNKSQPPNPIGKRNYNPGNDALARASSTNTDSCMNNSGGSYSRNPRTGNRKMVIMAIYYGAKPAERSDNRPNASNGPVSRTSKSSDASPPSRNEPTERWAKEMDVNGAVPKRPAKSPKAVSPTGKNSTKSSPVPIDGASINYPMESGNLARPKEYTSSMVKIDISSIKPNRSSSASRRAGTGMNSQGFESASLAYNGSEPVNDPSANSWDNIATNAIGRIADRNAAVPNTGSIRKSKSSAPPTYADPVVVGHIVGIYIMRNNGSARSYIVVNGKNIPRSSYIGDAPRRGP